MSGAAVSVRPIEIVACAQKIRASAQDLISERNRLAGLLEAAGGAGGDSKDGKSFAQGYDEPAGQMLTVFGSLGVGLECIANALESMAGTYEYVDEMIAYQFDSIDPQTSRRTQPEPPRHPPSPSQLRPVRPPSMSYDGNGGSWSLLYVVADAWASMARTLETVHYDDMHAVNQMTADNSGLGLGMFALKWLDWVGPSGYLPSVAESSAKISKYVQDRADKLREEGDFVGGFISGLWDSTVGAVVGLGAMVVSVIQNPKELLDAAIALNNLSITILTRPDEVFTTTVNMIEEAPGAAANMINYMGSMSPHDWGYALGQATGMVVTTAAGGELADVADLDRLSEVANLDRLGEAGDLAKLDEVGELGDTADLSRVDDVADGARPPVTANEDGTFNVNDWSGYPDYLDKPDPPFKLLEGDDYDAARTDANNANKRVRASANDAGVGDLNEYQVHEVKPVKEGGSPTDLGNKVLLPKELHTDVTTWWKGIQRAAEALR